MVDILAASGRPVELTSFRSAQSPMPSPLAPLQHGPGSMDPVCRHLVDVHQPGGPASSHASPSSSELELSSILKGGKRRVAAGQYNCRRARIIEEQEEYEEPSLSLRSADQAHMPSVVKREAAPAVETETTEERRRRRSTRTKSDIAFDRNVVEKVELLNRDLVHFHRREEVYLERAQLARERSAKATERLDRVRAAAEARRAALLGSPASTGAGNSGEERGLLHAEPAVADGGDGGDVGGEEMADFTPPSDSPK